MSDRTAHALTPRQLHAFDAAYERLSARGACDSPGGMEYLRVRQEWSQVVGSSDAALDAFIRQRAGAGPFDPESPHS